MKTKNYIYSSFLEFKKNWIQYFLLVQTINLSLSFLIIPVFRWSTSYVLRLGNIPYLSYTNFVEALTSHPIVFIVLFLLLVLLVALAYFQFTFLIIGLYSIKNGNFSIRNTFFSSLSKLRLFRISSLPFFIGYFLIIIPFSNTVYATDLLNKVTIPIFIEDFISENILFSIILTVLSIIIFIIGIRLIFTLPFMVLKSFHAREATKKSLEITKNKFWHYALRLVLIPVIISIIFFVIYFIIYLLQSRFDLLNKPWSLIMGVINLSIVQFLSLFMTTFISAAIFNILIDKVTEYGDDINLKEKSKKSFKFLKLPKIAFSIVLLGLVILYNALYLDGVITDMPETISHRGVNNKNGVQNTISALEKTIKLNPDYVEMDVQETRDKEFVVMHDNNLKNLTGVSKNTHELNLDEITNLTAKENGFEDKISSFDEYLKFADDHNQKLLIEIKTSKRDSKDMLENFVEKYKDDILEHDHKIHSLDYNVIKKLKEISPEINVKYILPYNFSFPNTEANGYTMEETTLDDAFVIQAHILDKQVYAWTVNDTLTMNKMIFTDIDGIITDNLEDLNGEISSFEDNPNISDRFLNYIPMLSIAHLK